MSIKFEVVLFLVIVILIIIVLALTGDDSGMTLHYRQPRARGNPSFFNLGPYLSTCQRISHEWSIYGRISYERIGVSMRLNRYRVYRRHQYSAVVYFVGAFEDYDTARKFAELPVPIEYQAFIIDLLSLQLLLV